MHRSAPLSPQPPSSVPALARIRLLVAGCIALAACSMTVPLIKGDPAGMADPTASSDAAGSM